MKSFRTRTSVGVICSCLVLNITIAAMPAQDPSAARGAVLASFSVPKNGDGLLLPVQMYGKEYCFQLDTGASVSVFDISLPLGDPVETAQFTTHQGQITLNLYKAPAASIGALPFKVAAAVPAHDFSKFRKKSGHPIRGVIGMDFLAKHIVQVDFDKGQLNFLQDVEPGSGEKLPLSFQDRRPYLAAEALGQSHNFLIDTGCVRYGASLDKAVFDQAIRVGHLKNFASDRWLDASGESESRVAKGSKLRIGGFVITDPCFGEGNGNLFGLGFWSRFVVTFDFANGAVYLKKGEQFERLDRWNRSGLRLTRSEGKTLAERVDKDSPAGRSGMKLGDEILGISGRNAREVSVFELERLLAAPGETISLVVRRGEKDYQAAIKLPQ